MSDGDPRPSEEGDESRPHDRLRERLDRLGRRVSDILSRLDELAADPVAKSPATVHRGHDPGEPCTRDCE